MNSAEKFIGVAVVLFLAFLIYDGRSEIERQHKFQNVCTEAGGIAVWDGRQNQCIMKNHD